MNVGQAEGHEVRECVCVCLCVCEAVFAILLNSRLCCQLACSSLPNLIHPNPLPLAPLLLTPLHLTLPLQGAAKLATTLSEAAAAADCQLALPLPEARLLAAIRKIRQNAENTTK